MATPADQRLTELLDRWLTSLDLHIKYSSLDEDTYWKVQPWVEHQRPARWILDLAREKTASLRAEVEARSAAGDGRFADALEQMMFLANLVGLQHIERFIPVAEPQNERSEAPPAAETTGTREMPKLSTSSSGTREMPQLSLAATGTREMPRPTQPRSRAPVPGALVARAERKGGAATRGGTAKAAPRKAAHAPAGAPPDPKLQQVAADAVRLLQWGRRWFELAELIARMADRPPVSEVRRLLDENRAKIEKAALDAQP